MAPRPLNLVFSVNDHHSFTPLYNPPPSFSVNALESGLQPLSYSSLTPLLPTFGKLYALALRPQSAKLYMSSRSSFAASSSLLHPWKGFFKPDHTADLTDFKPEREEVVEVGWPERTLDGLEVVGVDVWGVDGDILGCCVVWLDLVGGLDCDFSRDLKR